VTDGRRGDWRTVVLALGAAGGAIMAFSVAGLILAYAALGPLLAQLADGKHSPLELVVLASAILVIGIVFLPAAYYSIQRLRGRAVPAAVPRPMRIWQGSLLVMLWAGAAAGAGYLLENQVARWLTPGLFVLAIGIPALFFVVLAAGGLHPGSRERLWGALASGIGLGVVPAMIAELALAVVGLIGVAAYVSVHPEQLAVMQRLANQLRDSADIQQVLNSAAPWLTSPLVLIAAFAVFSVISPLIEETTKSLTTWAVFDRLTSPAQGFAIGAMSGAAFGLVESLLASSTPGAGWTTTLLVRGASTMMHIMSASLTGWGIAMLRTRRSVGTLIGMYLLAMSLHGAWNGSVVAITYGGLRSALAPGSRDWIGIAFIAMGAAVLGILCVGIPLGMAGINWQFRRTAGPSNAAIEPAEIWDSPARSEGGSASAGIAAEPRTPADDGEDTRPTSLSSTANHSEESHHPPSDPIS